MRRNPTRGVNIYPHSDNGRKINLKVLLVLYVKKSKVAGKGTSEDLPSNYSTVVGGLNPPNPLCELPPFMLLALRETPCREFRWKCSNL